MNAPDTTELLETIDRLKGVLGLTAMYCEHPDVVALPFARNSKSVAEKARGEMDKADALLQRAGY